MSDEFDPFKSTPDEPELAALLKIYKAFCDIVARKLISGEPYQSIEMEHKMKNEIYELIQHKRKELIEARRPTP